MKNNILTKGEVFTRSYLVTTMRQSVGLEVRGIRVGLCHALKRGE